MCRLELEAAPLDERTENVSNTREKIATAATDNGWEKTNGDHVYDRYIRGESSIHVEFTPKGGVTYVSVRGGDRGAGRIKGSGKAEQVLTHLATEEKTA